ncbi:MAG: PPC domain-containing protein [Planctomycetota bacterium]
MMQLRRRTQWVGRWSLFVMTVACWGALLSSSAQAQMAYPMVMTIRPVAAQVGATSEHTIHSRYSMEGAYAVLVSGRGVQGEVVPVPPTPPAADGKKKPELVALKVQFTVAPDAEPGVRDVRVATPQGVSTVGQLVIGRDPVFRESDKNDTAELATMISLPATICGAIEKAEDVDWYKFNVEAGTALTFHVRSSRLQDRIHDLQTHSDPIITLRTASGQTLAANDNFFFGDPLLSYRFEQSGDYLLEIRDVRYQGNTYWDYSIEVHGRPFVETVFPLAISRGQPATIDLIGYQLTSGSRINCTPGMELLMGEQNLRVTVGNELTDPFPVIVTDLPLVLEAPPALAANEPNASGKDAAQQLAATLSQAQAIAILSGVNGRIESDADVDYYVFEAKKGDALNIEVIARRRQSRLDSHLRVLNEKGQQLVANDDLRLGRRTSADSAVENWMAPADGRYYLEVRDVHLRGGPAFPYFLRITRSMPSFDLYLDTDKTQISPGGNAVLFCRVERRGGFTGAVQLDIHGLPTGVTAKSGLILPEKSVDGCIVLEADADAPLSAVEVQVTGTATHPLPDGSQLAITRSAIPYQEIYLPGGGRGHWNVLQHIVAVTKYGDIRYVKLSDYDLTLKPGESRRIDVTLERSPDFTQNVTLEMVYQHLGSIFGNSLPPGVTVDDKASKSLLAGGTNQGHITIKAAADAAPVERQQVAVMANVSLNFVMKATYASRPVTITIAK